MSNSTVACLLNYTIMIVQMFFGPLPTRRFFCRGTFLLKNKMTLLFVSPGTPFLSVEGLFSVSRGFFFHCRGTFMDLEDSKPHSRNLWLTILIPSSHQALVVKRALSRRSEYISVIHIRFFFS